MLDARQSARLYELEERVYGRLVSDVRALRVGEPEKRRLVDAAMAILCDAEAALESAQPSRTDEVLASACEQLDALEREVAAR